MTAGGAADQPKRLKFAKACALAILAAISLLGPILEAAVTGRIEEYGNFAVAETFLSIAPIYWWYYVDKQERQFRAGALLNVGVIALAAIALPVYFIRSRGWKRGGIAIAAAAGVLAATLALDWLGETIGEAITSQPQTHALPVLPKPPAPRLLASNSSTTLSFTWTTGTTTSCAIRSIGLMVNAAMPRFHTETMICPW